MASSRAVAAGLVGADTPTILLNGRFEIAADELSDKIGTTHAPAHAAKDRLSADHAIFAMVCNPDVLPRAGVLEYLKGFPSRQLLRLLDHGVAFWPETLDHRHVLIYERPPGPRLVPLLSAPFDPLAELDIINHVIAPVVGVLDELAGIEITHGGVRPTNMFRARDPKASAMLGEMASAPGHFNQPATFCSIPLLQAHPAGRGSGTHADDIYALGVTILALVIGKDPAMGRDDATLLRDKLERGSFLALCGHHRLPSLLREPLRGMLDDRVDLRWNLDDLKSWLLERRLKSLHHSVADRAQRGLAVGGKTFHHPRPLSHHMAQNWENIRLEEHGHEIMSWARRSLGDDGLGDAVLSAMESGERGAEGSSGALNPALVSRLAMALDPHAPIRFRGMHAHIDGLPSLLAFAFQDAEMTRTVTEAIMEDLPAFRHRTMSGAAAVKPSLLRALAHEIRVLRNPVAGFGVERCLYDLNPMQYCRSPLVVDQKVMQVADLMPALEKASARNHSGPPFDRHLAAFIAAHLRADLQPLLLMAGNQKDPERAALGMLGILATLQTQTGSNVFPGVARWIGKYLDPAIDSFHHRMWREKVRNEMPGLIDRGDIAALYLYLANGEARQHDRKGYAEAIAEYARLSTEISFLKSMGFNDPRRVQEYGHQIAAGLAGLLSIVAVAVSIFISW
ncbi:MAG: hypothetical protein RL477_199 [Pseudomonadota bacterium]